MANIIVNQFLDESNNIIGIAPNAKLFDFNISNSKEQYFFSDILKIFDYIMLRVPDIPKRTNSISIK